MIKVKKPQDIGAAILFIILGIVGLSFGSSYPFGTLARMGPGFFPIVLSWLLIAFGLIVGAMAFAFNEGPRVAKPNWRGILMVVAGIILFGALINNAGLALTAFAVPLLVSFATPEVRWKEAMVLSLFLSVASVLIFIYGLRQPMYVFFGG